MPTITILEKLYRSIPSSKLDKRYSILLKGLDVQVNYLGTTNRGWINLDIKGDDQTVALRLIDQEFGIAPVSLEDYKKYSVLQGKIFSSNRSVGELDVDLGINSLKSIDALLSKKTLSAQLADGKDISIKTLAELFCLFENMPIEIRVNQKFKQNRNTITASLSENQVRLFNNWINDRFDRLIILGSLISDVKKAVKYSRTSRDIIRTECLGLLEQSILCKLGTDAVGLIPKLGRYLKPAVLASFSPKRIIKKIGSQDFITKINSN